MKKIIILQEIIFGFSVIMYRKKDTNGKKTYIVVSSLHYLDHYKSIMCETEDYNKAFTVYANSINEIVNYKIEKYKKEHGYK